MARKSAVERKKEILSHAQNIIFRDGPGQFTMRKLSRSVGITEAGIYRHYESKKELYIALIENLFAPWMEEMNIVDHTNKSAIEKLMKISEVHLNFLLKEKLNPILFIAESMNPGNEDISLLLFQRLTFINDIVKNILEKGIIEGSLKREFDVAAVASCFVSVMQSAAIQFTIVKNDEKVKKRMNMSIEFLINQIGL